MSVNLSPLGGAGAQFFSNNGVPLAGGLLYTYVAGTSTPATTYTSSSGLTALANPIVLDSAGRVPTGEIWLTDGISYKFVLKSATDVLIATWDNLSGINSNFIAYTSQQQTITATAGQTVFDLTIDYVPGVNNLAVFVNGSKQIAGVNYLETDSNTVTFLTGLNVGDVVQFSTATPVASNVTTADNVAYVASGAGAVATNVQTKLRESVSVKDYGAVGDGVANDSAAILAAIATGKSVTFPFGTYNCGVYASPVNINLTTEGQALYLQGSTLRMIGKGNINANADNILIDLQGGVITQYIGYAEVATNTTPGGSTIQVVDSSNLFVGQSLASSFTMNIVPEYPLGGPTNPTFTVQSIAGNTVTLNKPMTGSTDYLATGVIFGDFSFNVLFQCKNDNFTVRNGIVNRATGYYYHSPNAINSTGGNIYFENVFFESNGTDQFLIKHSQKLHLTNCRSNQQWDYAKTGVYFSDTGSLYISDSNLELGNFDAAVTVNSFWDGTINGGEIMVDNSTITGTSKMAVPVGIGLDALGVFDLLYNGSFNRIMISNSQFTGYTRYFISSTVLARTELATLDLIAVDNCVVNSNAFCFNYTGAAKGFSCPNVNVSNTSFYVSASQSFDFVTISGAAGATVSFAPRFDSCYFKLEATGKAIFNAPSKVSNSIFNSTNYKYNTNRVDLVNCTFTNSTIAVTPAFDLLYYGNAGILIIDSVNFPTNPGAVFTAFGGSSASGGLLAEAKSINGTTYYKVFKIGSNIAVSGTFYKVNGVYFLRDDDYYIPNGSLIQDTHLGTVEKVTFNLATTLTAAAAAGATSITVTSATGIATGDKLNVLCDNGLVSTVTVGSYSSGLTIPISALGFAAANGSKINFFRVV